ncbi:MAG TPA: DUF4349 domain-containing protein [Acidobacteriaceae bacterium]|jgi:hypothetical protein
MKIVTEHVAPEEIMAALDQELTSAETAVVLAHLDECAECALVREQLRSASEALAAWSLPDAPAAMDGVVEAAAAPAAGKASGRRPSSRRPDRWNPLAFVGSAALAVVAVAAVIGLVQSNEGHDFFPGGVVGQRAMAPAEPAPTTPAASDSLSRAESRTGTLGGEEDKKKLDGFVGGGGSPVPAPMIARTVSLTILVKNIVEARAALDQILAGKQGYAAQLTVETPENGSRSFQASLRIPATELAAALGSLRGLGQVQGESQSGEEVTRQHADLVARLTNARETEERLRAILQQRAGKMDEVLQVEEQISETRGQIESMEAEQVALEHRVSYATVELQLTEEYKAQLLGTSASAGTQMHNAFITGLRNAGESLFGRVLFVEEYGPELLLWIAIVGIPASLLWRRNQRVRRVM